MGDVRHCLGRNPVERSHEKRGILSLDGLQLVYGDSGLSGGALCSIRPILDLFYSGGSRALYMECEAKPQITKKGCLSCGQKIQ